MKTQVKRRLVDSEQQESLSSSESTSEPSEEYIIKNKPQIHEFLSNLLRTNMSDKVLVDITINDDPDDNKVVIVGRPPVYGSARQQMRHVTPYSFVEKSIKAKVMEMSPNDITTPIKDLISKTLGILSSIQHEGICLVGDKEYLELGKKLGKNLNSKEQHFFDMKMETEKHGNKNVYYLIDDIETINNIKELESCKSKGVVSGEKTLQNAQNDYNLKFRKYVSTGFQYLLTNVQEDHNALTITCEAIARFILTIFNQEKGSSFTDEGNSLLEEIRLYTHPVARLVNTSRGQYEKIEYQEEVKYNICIHKEIIEKIKQNKYLTKDKIYIRIVDNEGPLVQKVAKALSVLDKILSTIDHQQYSMQVPSLCTEYQTYDQSVRLCDEKLENYDAINYNMKLDSTNFLRYFHYHAAKHLYSVFDFKPLEKQVLAPKQLNDTEIVKVYTIADKYDSKYLADYSVQNGCTYRDISANRVKGPSREVIRSKMSDQDTKEALMRKAIVHIFIALLPFSSLLAKTSSNEEKSPIEKIFHEFILLIMIDYNANENYLDNTWKNKVSTEFNNLHQHMSLDDSNVSVPTFLDSPLIGKIDLNLNLS